LEGALPQDVDGARLLDRALRGPRPAPGLAGMPISELLSAQLLSADLPSPELPLAELPLARRPTDETPWSTAPAFGGTDTYAMAGTSSALAVLQRQAPTAAAPRRSRVGGADADPGHGGSGGYGGDAPGGYANDTDSYDTDADDSDGDGDLATLDRGGREQLVAEVVEQVERRRRDGLDEHARWLWPRLRSMLAAELRLDRERAGRVRDRTL
jgi:hypothetical protein